MAEKIRIAGTGSGALTTQRKEALERLAADLRKEGHQVDVDPHVENWDNVHRSAGWLETVVIVLSSGAAAGTLLVVNGALSEAGKDLYGLAKSWVGARYEQSRPDEDSPGIPQRLEIRSDAGNVLATYELTRDGGRGSD